MLTNTRKYEILRQFKQSRNSYNIFKWFETLTQEEIDYLQSVVDQKRAPVSPDVSTVLKG